MRMIFEIRDFKFASKSQVSLAGILYIIDDEGYQWRDYYKSWMNQINSEKEVQEGILRHIDTFLVPCLKFLKSTRLILDLVF